MCEIPQRWSLPFQHSFIIFHRSPVSPRFEPFLGRRGRSPDLIRSIEVSFRRPSNGNDPENASYMTIAKAYTSVSLLRRGPSKPNSSGKSNSGASHRTDQGSHSGMETPTSTSEAVRKDDNRKLVRTAEWSPFTKTLDWEIHQVQPEMLKANDVLPSGRRERSPCHACILGLWKHRAARES